MRNDYRRTIIGQIFHIIKSFREVLKKVPLLLVVIYYQASDRKGTENGIHHFCKAYFCGRPHILSSISTFLDLCRWHCSIYLPHRNISESLHTFLQCTMYIVHVNILRFAYFLQHMYTYLCKCLCTCLSLYLCSISSIFVISGREVPICADCSLVCMIIVYNDIDIHVCAFVHIYSYVCAYLCTHFPHLCSISR